MVLLPILDHAPATAEPIPIWEAIEPTQIQNASEYWLVTQPAHAALAGEIAAALREDMFGPITGTVSRAIALHDAGWSLDDAEQIQLLRANPKLHPRSFIEAPAGEVLRAWTGSIETTAKFDATGGYLVSRHFERLSQGDHKNAALEFERFRTREKQRQKLLLTSVQHDKQTLERLVDALQFCDALSLYLCCGSSQPVTIHQPAITITRPGGGYKLEPTPFNGPVQFSFSALRHPAPTARSAKSGATFYLSL